MTYYILTKRSAPSDTGKLSHHHIHGITPNISAARAWFRATRTTDVIEANPDEHGAHQFGELISDMRLESWREQALRQELEASRIAVPGH